MVFTDFTHLGTLTQCHHFGGQASQYRVGSSFILMQTCVHKLGTLVSERGENHLRMTPRRRSRRQKKEVEVVETIDVEHKSCGQRLY